MPESLISVTKVIAITATTASVVVLAACGSSDDAKAPSTDLQRPQSEQIRVIDADTVDIDGTRYRLAGIDAPERYQKCRAWGRTWDCGAAATEALMLRSEGMSCEGSDTDRYGRVIGVCSSGGEDLNAWLVENGWALAYREYSSDYVAEESRARSSKRGIHRGEFIEPWDWRAGERIEGEDTFTGIASDTLDIAAVADRMLRGDTANVYGRWLEDSVFVIVDETVAVSFGASPGTNPTGIGGGVWTGSLVGMDEETGERVVGDARIEIDDFARSDVDIAFTSIEDAGGRERASLRWEDIPIVQGAFLARNPNGVIEGRFYGSDHGEVGGIFERDELVGAFGGSR